MANPTAPINPAKGSLLIPIAWVLTGAVSLGVAAWPFLKAQAVSEAVSAADTNTARHYLSLEKFAEWQLIEERRRNDNRMQDGLKLRRL